MSSGDSLNQSMDIAAKRYSSLFRLPSARKVPLLLLSICVGGSTLSTAILFQSFFGVWSGLLLGFGVFVTSMVADLIINALILEKDPVFDMRRTMALSVFCWAIWLFFLLIGVIIGAVVTGLKYVWWIRLSLFGFSATLILRFLVFNATSSRTQKRLFTASVLQPFLNIIPFIALWSGGGFPASVNVLGLFVFLVSSVAVGFAVSFSFLFLLNRMGKQTVGLKSASLFKAFMLNWVSGLNAPFEDLLEHLGEKQDVEVSMIKFGLSETRAAIVVPSVHPGPFKNVGSSLLPAMLKSDLEKELGCIACVPHGVLGHEYDLASQLENKKVIREVVSCLKSMESNDENVSPFVTVSSGSATACCQAFGKSAFISFTLAPQTIEDLPLDLARFVKEETEKRGLQVCAVVNAHNSLDRAAEMQEAMASLKDVAVECLDKALSYKESPFEIGVASVLPKEFSLEDGMGSGGITVIAVKRDPQKAAYIVIDGNNMVSGLRERILSSLRSIGIDDGEVFTTDTHEVSGLIRGKQGYHPVGEAIENEKLISYIKEATLSALTTMSSTGVSSRSITVRNVKVIGAKQLEALCLLIDRAIGRAKKIVIPIFGLGGLTLMLLLLFV